MALSDKDKDFLGIPLIAASFLGALAKTTGLDTFASASSAIEMVPVEKVAEALAAMRTDKVFIESGTMEIGDSVTIEIFDDEEE